MTLVDIHLLNAMRAERDAALAENARLRAAVRLMVRIRDTPRAEKDWGVERHPEVDAQFRIDLAAITKAERAAFGEARLAKHGSTLTDDNVQHVIDRIADYPEIVTAALALAAPTADDGAERGAR